MNYEAELLSQVLTGLECCLRTQNTPRIKLLEKFFWSFESVEFEESSEQPFTSTHMFRKFSLLKLTYFRLWLGWIVHFGLKTLGRLSSFIWVFDRLNWLSLRKVVSGHSIWGWFFQGVFSLKHLLFQVLINVSCSFWSKNTQLIKLFHMNFWPLKLVESEESCERTFDLSFGFF